VSIDKPVERGTLYVVATPIGNLADLSPRAQTVLGAVDLILAEDTRRSPRLLTHFGIHTPLLAYHDHNERHLCAELAERLASGESMALISDAGTPLLCDPVFHLLETVHGAGVRVISIPGPSALVVALAVSGLPAERFAFEGFLPQKREARRKRLADLGREARTWCSTRRRTGSGRPSKTSRRYSIPIAGGHRARDHQAPRGDAPRDAR
jgi:16S rRNA (cytidine1402-2'-O)-methyltransferase